MVVVVDATPPTLVWQLSIVALLQPCTSADNTTLPPLMPMKFHVVSNFMSLLPLRMPRNAGSAPVVGSRDMYRTKVLLYRTMVLLARPTARRVTG